MTLTTICILLGGMGAFLLGFKILSTNMEKMSTGALRNLFSRTSDKKFVGIGIGALSAALVHSSAVTTVMTIGLVNAGIMSLVQAATVIMGANIGTTITAQIVALGAFPFTEFAMVLAVIGVFMVMLAKKEKTKTIGYIVAAFGLVFAGLWLASYAVDIMSQEPQIVNLLQTIKNPFLLLLLGVVLTAVMQSSTAITSIIIVTVQSGLVIGGGGNSVLYLILGSNIGTCVTAIISSIGTSPNAKRVAVIHLLFNVIGTAIFMIVLLCWQGFMDMTFAKWFAEPATQIAMFHTFFNVICTLIFLPFTNLLVKCATALVRAPKAEQTAEEKIVLYLDKRLLKSPGVAIGAVISETKHMANVSMSALSVAVNGFMNKDESCSAKVAELISKTVKINTEITSYLVDISAKNVSMRDEQIVTSVHGSLSDIERLAELGENIARYTAHCVEQNLVFSDSVIVELDEMFAKTTALFTEAMRAFDLDSSYNTKLSEQLEDDIDNYRKVLLDGHMKRLNEGRCKPESSGVFINLVNNLERAGDHLLLIAHAFDGVASKN